MDGPPDLFGGDTAVEIQKPPAPPAERWSNIERLNKEKEVVGIYISAHPLDDFKLELSHFTRGDLRAMSNLPGLENHELALAGMVTGSEHRMTKTGKPFGTFELEDFYDVHKFFLFGEDYLRMKHFLVSGSFLFIRGKVVPKKWSKTHELEFKITAIELLTDIREKLTKNVTIEMHLQNLSDGILDELDKVISAKKNGASKPVEFRVLDSAKKLSIRMPSRSAKIDLSNETINHLDTIREVKYTLNT